jgi:hypothetical protein
MAIFGFDDRSNPDGIVAVGDGGAGDALVNWGRED